MTMFLFFTSLFLYYLYNKHENRRKKFMLKERQRKNTDGMTTSSGKISSNTSTNEKKKKREHRDKQIYSDESMQMQMQMTPVVKHIIAKWICGWTQQNAIHSVMAFRAAAQHTGLITYPSSFSRCYCEKVKKKWNKKVRASAYSSSSSFVLCTKFRLKCHFFYHNDNFHIFVVT